MVEIKRLIYRGINSISMESTKCRAIFFTEFGAKFVSLLNLENNYEFLWQGACEEHPLPVYDSLYVENDLCGADDIFPSINRTFYPDFPWEGTICPAHGELWSIPWRTEAGKQSLTFTTHGIRFPYRFQRRVSFVKEATIRFDYRIENHSPFDMPGIWALHPLFNAGSDTKIHLPKNTDEILNTLDFNSRLGNPGTVHQWPITNDRYGSEYILDEFIPNSGVCEKFFINHELKSGVVTLERNATGQSIRLHFPPEKVPYLGVWKNQGGLLGQNNIALEPATGTLDDVNIARKFNSCSILPGSGSMEFSVDLEII